MSKKTTYRHKNADKIGISENAIQQRIEISQEVRAKYEDGVILNIDKPLHWTSFDVIRKLRGILRIKKIGHAGTLDPLATGVLLVCTGKFTKKINDLMADEKEYTGSFTLGAVTPTYDLESTPEQQKDFTFVTTELLNKTKEQFIGTILQKPPIYSAIKKDGVALYELARRGEEVEIKAREITIKEFDITKVELPIIEFRVICTTGTYIRSLAHDFGAALGCGGYLSELRRTRVGSYNVQDGISVNNFIASLT